MTNLPSTQTTLRVRGGEEITVTETAAAHPYLAFKTAKGAFSAIARDPFEDVEDIAAMEVREADGAYVVFMLYSEDATVRRIARFERDGSF